jgi:hypothetical protein
MDTAKLPSMTRNLERVGVEGWAHVPKAVHPDLLGRIIAETSDLAFKPAEPVINPVLQNCSYCTLSYPREIAGQFRSVTELLRDLMIAARDAGRPGWWPNQVMLHRYPEAEFGIGSHRDRRAYRQLVAVVSLSGTADLSFYAEDRSTVLKTVRCKPGSLLWLQGWDRNDPASANRRPIHGVTGGIRGERTSIAFRMYMPLGPDDQLS